MRPLPIARWSEVPDREPVGALVGNVDLVIVRYDDEHSVLYGRCDHRGALLADGTVRGDDLVCGVHGWDYGFRTGISAYNHDERLQKFGSWVDGDQLMVDADERPLLDDAVVGTDVTIGASAAAPLHLDIPLFVSDMSFGALSQEAKVALARGAESAGTGICSGEGGMLDEERHENSRYFYELASAKFGWSIDKVRDVQAFHFKFGQGAKTGTGGHLPGNKVVGRIAEVRRLPEGTAAVSPATFTDLRAIGDYRDLAAQVREVSGGIPIGAKLSAQHIEADLDAALEIGVDYVILDGRGGGTGAAPSMFRDHISIPTIPALARARRHLDACDSDATLVITGGLRTHVDFVKALALGADAVAISNSALQAIGCLGMRACNTDNCPVGIATQKPGLRQRLVVDDAARRLTRFLESTVELMTVLARACGHAHLRDLCLDDLTTFDRDMHHLAGIPYGGVDPRRAHTDPHPVGVR